MRILARLFAAVLTLAAPVSQARAEFPFFASGCAGLGLGGASQTGLSSAGSLFGLVAADLAWSPWPGRALVLSIERGLVGSMGVYHISEERYIDSANQTSVLLGPEWSRGARTVRPYLGAGLGYGRLTTKDSRSFTTGGVALSGRMGLRLLPPPGPVGFTVGFRTSHVFARNASSSGIALTLGLELGAR